VRRALPVLLAVVAVVTLAGCGKDSPAVDGRAGSSSTTAPTTTTTVVKGHFASPLEAASHLMAAWKAGDTTAALESAAQAAVDTLFEHEYSQYQSRGCDAPGQLGSDCNFRLSQAGGVRIHVVADPTAGFLVQSVFFID
jgi:hypothetical protein